MRIFDSHAHYDSHQFEADREELLSRIQSDDQPENFVPVKKIVDVGADMETSASAIKLSEKYEFIYAAVGVHPDSAGKLIFSHNSDIKQPISENSDHKLNVIEENEEVPVYTYDICLNNRERLKKYAVERRVIAVGEIGLDYHWDVWPRDIQKKAFEWQWRMASEFNLPVIIHSRDAAEDTLNMIKDFYAEGNGKELKAVMHCYSYSAEHAKEYLKMGLMFGIGGVVTFKNAKKLNEVVDMLPLDRILLETDCPYMAPDPFRGKRNHSGYLCYVAEKIAEIKGVDVKKIYDCTWENAERFFCFKK